LKPGTPASCHLCLSEIKSAYIGDAIHSLKEKGAPAMRATPPVNGTRQLGNLKGSDHRASGDTLVDRFATLLGVA